MAKRSIIEEWKIGAFLSEELLIEKREILSKLKEGSPILSVTPTEEEIEEEKAHLIKIKQTKTWEDWTNWIEKVKSETIIYLRLDEETDITRSIIEFYTSGRHIFNLFPSIIHLLDHTEISDIKFADLKLSYEHVYLHFGPLSAIEYPIEFLENKHKINFALQSKKYILDGAFISSITDGIIDVRLTFIDQKDNFLNKIAITKDFRFPTIEFSIDFSYYLNNEGKNSFKNNLTLYDATMCFSDIWDREEEALEFKFGDMHDLLMQPENYSESELKQYSLFYNSFMLIVNSIRYIKSGDSKIDIGTTNTLATELLLKLKKTKKHQERTKLAYKLSKYSFSTIHTCINKQV